MRKTPLMKRRLALGLVPAALAVIAAGCGGGSPSGTIGPASGAVRPESKAAVATLATGHTKLGTVLVDGEGRSLYLFEKDKGNASTCYGACASIWPPVTTSAEQAAGGGLPAAKLGSAKRTDGKTQVTYSGHPLYTYAGDGKPGATAGQGLDQFGAKWYVLAPSGHKIDSD
jgi:predicted lipoprotein with Yx(FWY)xxD motif